MLYKSKLISLLSSLQSREYKKLEDFILSPYFNKNNAVIELFNFLKPLYPKFLEKKLDIDKAYHSIYNSKHVDEQKLRYVMSDLTKLIEDFLTIEELNNRDFYKKHLLLTVYSQNNIDKYFSQNYESTLQAIEKLPNRDVNYFFYKHLIQENAYIHSSIGKPRSIDTFLQKSVDNLDLYYLTNKLRYSCAILNRQDLLKENYSDSMLEEIINYLGKSKDIQIPAIGIYYNILMTFKDHSNEDIEKHYLEAKKLLEKNRKCFEKDEQRDMYIHILNFCIKQLNIGKEDYLKEMFQIYEVLLDEDLMLANGFLSPSDFKNIVTVALRLNQVLWAENFIEGFKEKINLEYRENTYLYNKAFLYHYQKKYSEALKTLNQVEMNDVYYHLDSKVLLMRTYYELNEDEPFMALAEAFSHYLKRNKQISNFQKEAYLSFIKVARKLMHLKLGNRVKLSEVEGQLNSSEAIAGLHWLKAKFLELKDEIN